MYNLIDTKLCLLTDEEIFFICTSHNLLVFSRRVYKSLCVSVVSFSMQAILKSTMTTPLLNSHRISNTWL